MIENHVVNLELSKRLKELGFDKDNFFYWGNWGAHWTPKTSYKILRFNKNKTVLSKDSYRAYIATELLEILPEFLQLETHRAYFNIAVSVDEKDYCVAYKEHGFYNLHIKIDSILCNALAKMLIHLIENKLMEVKND